MESYSICSFWIVNQFYINLHVSFKFCLLSFIWSWQYCNVEFFEKFRVLSFCLNLLVSSTFRWYLFVFIAPLGRPVFKYLMISTRWAAQNTVYYTLYGSPFIQKPQRGWMFLSTDCSIGPNIQSRHPNSIGFPSIEYIKFTRANRIDGNPPWKW